MAQCNPVLHLSRTHSLNRFPEITDLLALSLDRIEESTSQTGPNALESNTSRKLTPGQIPEDLSGSSFNKINQMIEGLTNSIE